jgi:hypothetical protein
LETVKLILWYYLIKKGEARGRELEDRMEGFAEEHDLRNEKAGLERARQRDAIATTEERRKMDKPRAFYILGFNSEFLLKSLIINVIYRTGHISQMA